jgi:D-sedoheptulose 7-phosphate isomerase
MTLQSYIKHEIEKTRVTHQKILDNTALLAEVEKITDACVKSLTNGGKILFAGNGGSAADSQHLAAELVSRLCYNRPGLAGIALTTDTSGLTAIGNDYGFENLFSRQIEALGRAGDVFIGISTSGRSPNILKALKEAKSMNLITVGFTGELAQEMELLCDYMIKVPSTETPKIQESHILLGHIICALIEETIYGEQYNPKNQK